MKIHEYQAKQLLAAAGVTVPRGIVAQTADEAAAAYQQLGGAIAVVKSQIHAGGRGKGTFKQYADQRGVVLVKSADGRKKRCQNAGQDAGDDSDGTRRKGRQHSADRRRIEDRPRAYTWAWLWTANQGVRS